MCFLLVKRTLRAACYGLLLLKARTGFAVADGPVLPPEIDEEDEDILGAHTR
jgi:hypothetical protein